MIVERELDGRRDVFAFKWGTHYIARFEPSDELGMVMLLRDQQVKYLSPFRSVEDNPEFYEIIRRVWNSYLCLSRPKEE